MSETGRRMIKVSLSDDIRCIPIHNEDIAYEELVLMMQHVYRGKINTDDDVLIKYEDEDGDLVTICHSSDLKYAIHCRKSLKLTLFVNKHQQRRQLSSEESRHVRYQLQDIRDRINQLLDTLDCHRLPSVTESVTFGSRLASAGAGGGSGQVAATTTSSNAAAGSFQQLTRQKYGIDGSAFGSADTGGPAEDVPQHQAANVPRASSSNSGQQMPVPAARGVLNFSAEPSAMSTKQSEPVSTEQPADSVYPEERSFSGLQADGYPGIRRLNDGFFATLLSFGSRKSPQRRPTKNSTASYWYGYENSWLCRLCGERLPHRSAFHEHLSTKHGRWVCDECGATLASSGSLYNHNASKHLQLTRKCPWCSKCFRWTTQLTRHKRSHHADEYN